MSTEIAGKLGYVLFRHGRYDEASAILRPTLDRQRRIFGRLNQSTLRTLRSLESALRDQGALAEAESLGREALEITRSLYGENHVETGACLLSLAIVLERKGAFVEAERFARDALAYAERAYGPVDFNTAYRLRTLAAIRLARGDPSEAERLLRRALAGFRRTFPEDHPDEGDVINRLVYILVARHAPDADSIYREATRFELARPATGPWFVTDGYEYLGEAAWRMGDPALAERVFRRALALNERQLPEGHPYRVLATTGLSKALLESGRRR